MWDKRGFCRQERSICGGNIWKSSDTNIMVWERLDFYTHKDCCIERPWIFVFNTWNFAFVPRTFNSHALSPLQRPVSPMSSTIITPHARSHLHAVGSRPSHASFTVRSSCPHMRGNSSSLGTNVTIPNQYFQVFKLTSLSLFTRYLIEFLHMSKKLNDLSDRVLSQWFPKRKSSYAGADRETGQWRKHGKGGAQPNENVI